MMFLGFDPGGKGKFGCAILDHSTSKFVTTRAKSVEHAVEWVQANTTKENVVAAGIDTLLCWQTTEAGWRGADEYLRTRYPQCRNSISSANSLYGAMAVQGAVLTYRLRELFPQIFLTETHPKVLWHCLQKETAYPRLEDWQDSVPEAFEKWLLNEGLVGKIANEDEFDAVISAWAALQAFTGKWSHDLFETKAKGQKSENVSLVPDVHYFWPE